MRHSIGKKYSPPMPGVWVGAWRIFIPVPASLSMRCRPCIPEPACSHSSPYLILSYLFKTTLISLFRGIASFRGQAASLWGKGGGGCRALVGLKVPSACALGAPLWQLARLRIQSWAFVYPGERVAAFPLLNGRATGVDFSRDKRNPPPFSCLRPSFPRLQRQPGSIQPGIVASWVWAPRDGLGF